MWVVNTLQAYRGGQAIQFVELDISFCLHRDNRSREEDAGQKQRPETKDQRPGQIQKEHSRGARRARANRRERKKSDASSNDESSAPQQRTHQLLRLSTACSTAAIRVRERNSGIVVAFSAERCQYGSAGPCDASIQNGEAVSTCKQQKLAIFPT